MCLLSTSNQVAIDQSGFLKKRLPKLCGIINILSFSLVISIDNLIPCLPNILHRVVQTTNVFVKDMEIYLQEANIIHIISGTKWKEAGMVPLILLWTTWAVFEPCHYNLGVILLYMVSQPTCALSFSNYSNITFFFCES